MDIYPLKFEPVFKQRIWGGQRLREVFGKDIPAETKIGESWELADLPQDKSVIANGKFAGWTIDRLIEKYPGQITGDENFTGCFPLLIKFLDAQDILSVQVHPDEQTCRRTGEGEPKTECWYIIAADEDAVIYKGLKQGVTKEQFSESVKKTNVADLLEKVPVKAGQCHFIPAGTAHSIGAGLLIAEIQTPSDTTYRVFDWNRTDKSGKSRQLHVEQAMESIHFDSSCDELTVKTQGVLADCKYFRIVKEDFADSFEKVIKAGIMRILIVLDGSGTITDAAGFEIEFRDGDTLLVPAGYNGLVKSAGPCRYLVITV